LLSTHPEMRRSISAGACFHVLLICVLHCDSTWIQFWLLLLCAGRQQDVASDLYTNGHLTVRQHRVLFRRCSLGKSHQQPRPVVAIAKRSSSVLPCNKQSNAERMSKSTSNFPLWHFRQRRSAALGSGHLVQVV
jgi:hypothetical protein